MYTISVSLGTSLGIVTQKTYSYWNKLDEYEIKREDLKNLDLTFEELFMLYMALKRSEKNSAILQYVKKRIKHNPSKTKKFFR